MWLKCQNNKREQKFKQQKGGPQKKNNKKSVAKKIKIRENAMRIPSGRKVSEKESSRDVFIFPKNIFYFFSSNFWGSPRVVSIYLMWCLFIVLNSDNSSNLSEIARRLAILKDWKETLQVQIVLQQFGLLTDHDFYCCSILNFELNLEKFWNFLRFNFLQESYSQNNQGSEMMRFKKQ